MTIKSKKEYFQAIKLRYYNSDKQAKTTILDEFCVNCGYNRKYAIRLLNSKKQRNKKTPSGPKPKYQNKVLLIILKRLWFATDQMCSKKLKAANLTLSACFLQWSTIRQDLTP